ncbi:MAG: TolC family protein, partial [Candidatus Sulfotelmatobacter sp.]
MNGATWRAAALAFAFALPVSAQQATPLSQLIHEAQANNSSISAADHDARAARMVAPQKAALPDPTFT